MLQVRLRMQAGLPYVSGLEMAQNATHSSWTREEVDDKLRHIMASIHETCYHYGKEDGAQVNYAKGANIAGFVKVADAMIAQSNNRSGSDLRIDFR